MVECYNCGKQGSKEEFEGITVYDNHCWLCPDCMEEFMESDGWFDFLALRYEGEGK